MILITLLTAALFALTRCQLNHYEYFYVPSVSECKNIWWLDFPSHDVRSQETATYEENMDCDIHISIRGDIGGRGDVYGIKITFISFEMESPDNVGGPCPDYLQFFSDKATTVAASPRLCGKSLPEPIQINQTSIVFKLVTDGHNQRPGFSFKYEEVLLKEGVIGGGAGGGGNGGSGSGGTSNQGNGNRSGSGSSRTSCKSDPIFTVILTCALCLWLSTFNRA